MLTTIGGDLKFNFERSKQFDLAIDLNIQYTFASTDASDGCDTFCGPSGRWMYAYAPLLIGLNVDPDFALVGQLGGAFVARVGQFLHRGRTATRLHVAWRVRARN
ncbi:MAG: hypothetical protein IPI67_37195 [Myxococcales bacterium]|nr:hypothetical protein [Myxococcales bacterium]